MKRTFIFTAHALQRYRERFGGGHPPPEVLDSVLRARGLERLGDENDSALVYVHEPTRLAMVCQASQDPSEPGVFFVLTVIRAEELARRSNQKFSARNSRDDRGICPRGGRRERKRA